MARKVNQEIFEPYDQFSVRLSDELTSHLSSSIWHWSNGRIGHGQLRVDIILKVSRNAIEIGNA